MKILQIGTIDNKGGAALVSWLLKSEQERLGHTSSLAVGYKRSHDPSVIDLFDTPANRFVSNIIKKSFYQRLTYHLAYWRSNDISIPLAKKISGLPQYKEADIIHAHNLHSNFFNLNELPRLSKTKPFVWTLHDMWAFTGHSSYAFECEHWKSGGCSCPIPDSIPPHRSNNSKRLWIMKKNIYENSKLHIVVPSQWLFDLVRQSILKNHPLSLIYNGIDTEVFKPYEKNMVRTELGLPLNKKIVLFAAKGGKNNTRKGWEYADILIDLYKNAPNILFICLGGKEESTSQNNVHSIPYISDPALLAKYYSASDVLLYTSLADNCPLGILESLSCGLLVLAFKTGGIPELVRHKEHGYIADFKNIKDLARGFQWLLGLTDDEYKKMSDRCHSVALQKFDKKRMAEQYMKLYHRISNEHSLL